MDFIAQLSRVLEPIRNKIRMVIGRAIISYIDDSKNMQIVQIELLQGEVKDDVERVQNYGFTSHPLKGSEAIALFINGNRDHGLVISSDDSRYRIKNLPEGGVAIYDYDGNYCKLTKDSGIEIEAPNQNVKIKASGNIEIGNILLKKLITEDLITSFNSHIHLGVTVGSGVTGIPQVPLTDTIATKKVKAE